MAAGLAAGFLPAFFFAFFFAGFFAFFFAGFLAFFAFFLAGFLAFFFAAFFFLPVRRFAFLAGFFAIFLAAGRFLAAFFLPVDFFLVDFFAAFLLAAIAILLMKVKQRALPALRKMKLLGANRQCPAAREIGRITGHRTVLLAADPDLPCPKQIRERGSGRKGDRSHIGQLPETKRKETLGPEAHCSQPGGLLLGEAPRVSY
jgi:hypothetical protein